MSSWHERVLSTGEAPLKWPYPIRYGQESRAQADVLVLGGGPAGCTAAINAAREGASVILVDKSNPKGAGGSGCDHWLNTPNPCSPLTAEDCVEWESMSYGGYVNGLSRYISARESYDALLELEEIGAKIRDVDDEFAGAPFRDEKTKFLFAYDYDNRFIFRVWGTTFKPAMVKECKRLGVNIFDRTMVTGLLTEGGKPGNRVVGATAFNVRTGEFHVFSAKAVISSLGVYSGNWKYSSELTGLPYFHPGVLCDGAAVGFEAGAEFTMMEKSSAVPTPGYAYPSYGTGNPKNTWFPCNMIDAEGKPVPWVDYSGKKLETMEERTRPASGQRFLGERSPHPDYQAPHLADDLAGMVKRGEIKLPLYADLPSMPEQERRVIWDLMCKEEGRARVPIHDNYEAAGFDPSQDLLQSYFNLGGEPYPGMWPGTALPHFRGRGPFACTGGLVTDWNLMTNLEGLFAAGCSLYAANYYNHAVATGRYAGRKAAAFAARAAQGAAPEDRIKELKNRLLAPTKRRAGVEWKELRAGGVRVMQNFCGDPKNDELLKLALMWIEDLEENAVPETYAPNPHALMRLTETFNQLACDRMIILASQAREASSNHLGFVRQDYPEIDPEGWHKFITLKRTESGFETGELPLGFWGDSAQSYEDHNQDYKGFLKS